MTEFGLKTADPLFKVQQGKKKKTAKKTKTVAKKKAVKKSVKKGAY